MTAPQAQQRTRSQLGHDVQHSLPPQTAHRQIPAAHDAIERRAYEIYVAKGKGDGHQAEDWLEAESQLATAGELVLAGTAQPASARMVD